MKLRVILFGLFLCLPLAAQATPVVADLSNYRIAMDAGFNGERLFLFGARNDTGDIVAVVRGPQKNFMMRKKEEVAGIWVNSGRMKFFNVPDFYAIASSRPLNEIEQSGLFKRLGIGEDNLLTSPSDPKSMAAFPEFSQAFLQHQFARRLYTKTAGTVSFMGETLFKTVLDFPDDIPPGNYTAEIYLISDGEIAGMQSMPITVVKTGLDAFLYRHAHKHPAMYGISAILLALSAGWLASKIFERA